jgi:hypothetical protein
MLGSKIDLLLHLFICFLTWTVFSAFDAMVYGLFAALNYACLALYYMEWATIVDLIPKPLQAALGNAFSLLVFTKLVDDVAKGYVKRIYSDLKEIQGLLENGVGTLGSFLADNYCQLGCSLDKLKAIQASKQYWFNFWDTSISTLYWDAPLFAWYFCGLSILISLLKPVLRTVYPLDDMR